MNQQKNGVHPSKILVVDDAPINVKLMSDMLSRAGYQIVPETNSRQALINAQQENPDLILLDIMMPGLDGYEVCRQLKADETTRDIPVIFMSALTQINDKLKGFEAGGIDYVTRPFKQKEILARVEVHLALRQAQRALEQKNAQLSQEIATRQEIEAALRGHRAELADANQKLQSEIYHHQQTAQALQQAHDQMKQRADELETLNQIAQTVATSTDLTSVLNVVAKTINQLFKSNSTGIGLLNPDQTALISVAENSRRPNTPTVIGMTIPINATSAIAQVIKTSQSIIIEHPQTDPLTKSIHGLMKARNSKELMLAPLLARGSAIGIIVVDTIIPGRKFTPTELNLLETIAGQIAGAIENARLFDEERQQRQTAEQQNKELDAFAQTVAHDIKNPLSVVFTQADFMNAFIDRLDRSTMQKNIKIIKEHSLKGTNIVDELLLLAGVRKQEINATSLEMEKIIYQAQQRLYFLKEKYKGTILLPDTWPQATGYAPWIEEVWVNYISNGLKYGGEPPFLKLGATSQDNGLIRFWVRDNGPGISPEKQAILFTEFTRLNETRAQGHGLGLSIVRRIIKKLGGTVGVNSEEGRGSEFFFTLPTVGKLYETENSTL